MENVDFYKLGQKDVNDIYIVVSKRKKEIEEKYGKKASAEYSLGVVAAMDRFQKLNAPSIDINENIYGTMDFGKENTRNNSYFDSDGISKQYDFVDGFNGYEEYNEPELKK